MAPKLPAWLAPHPTREGCYVVDPDEIYPLLLDAFTDYDATVETAAKALDGQAASLKTAGMVADATAKTTEAAAKRLLKIGYSGKVDRNWLEIVYQCAKLERIRILREAGLPPWPPLVVNRGKAGYKDRWSLAAAPEGALKTVGPKHNDFSIADRKILGGMARQAYKKLRGYIPE